MEMQVDVHKSTTKSWKLKMLDGYPATHLSVWVNLNQNLL